jgi:hypothetical protein
MSWYLVKHMNNLWILGKSVGKCGLDSSGSGYGPMAGSCERGNKFSCSIKGGKFLD